MNIWLNGVMGVLVGDALGTPVQFLPRNEVKLRPVKGMEGFGTFNMPAGTWSDDGSMTLATLCSIKAKKEIDLEDIMKRFVAWDYKGEYTPFGESFDQGRTCTAAIYNYIVHRDINTCGLTDEGSNGNGSLMRIMPACLFAYEKIKSGDTTLAQAVEMVHQVSALTHAHLRSKIACGIYFFMVKAILDEGGDLKARLQKGIDEAMEFYRGDFSNLVQLSFYGRIADLEKFGMLREEDIKSSGYVVDTLEAAVWSVITTDSFSEGALKAVNLGWDTDSVAAVACGLSGLYYGYEGMPSEWIEVIQKKEWIESFLLDNKC